MQKRFYAIIAILLLWGILARGDTPEFDKRKAFSYLEKQVSFGPRNPGSIGHGETRNFLIEELGKFSREVIVQDFFAYGIRMSNIIASFGDGDETLLLAAHWDTRPYADRDPDPRNRDKPILGANDGASGVAVLLEIGRILSESPPSQRRVVIVLFDGEDFGRTIEGYLLGSRYFAENMGSIAPSRGVLIDMVGDRDLNILVEGYSFEAAPELVREIFRIAGELGYDEFKPRKGYYIMDDHIPLIERGVKMVDIIDFDYPHWHTLGDTADKCSPDSLERVGNVLLRLIYEK
ncbi:MAG: M28 family peptidase [bacterium]